MRWVRGGTSAGLAGNGWLTDWLVRGRARQDMTGQADCGHPGSQVVLQDKSLLQVRQRLRFSGLIFLLGTVRAHLGNKIVRNVNTKSDWWWRVLVLGVNIVLLPKVLLGQTRLVRETELDILGSRPSHITSVTWVLTLPGTPTPQVQQL